MGIKILFKRLTCNHQNKECLTNFGGDMINIVSTYKKIYRSAWECHECGKIIYSEKLEPTCNVTNWNIKKNI